MNDFDEYYETRLGHEEPTGHQEADKVSSRMIQLIHVPVFRLSSELHSRFLKIGQEYGSSVANAIADLHRHAGACVDVVNQSNDGVNDGVKLTPTAACAIKAILRNPHLSAPALAKILGTKVRQAERVRAALRKEGRFEASWFGQVRGMVF